MPHAFIDVTCDVCHGSGKIPDTAIKTMSFTCPNCDGLGIVGKYMDLPEITAPEPSEFGKWLRCKRLDGKITFTDLYSKTGILRSRISDIENGFNEPCDSIEEVLLRDAIHTLTTAENMMDTNTAKSIIDKLISTIEKYPGPFCDTELAHWEKEMTAIVKQTKEQMQPSTDNKSE